MSLQDWLPERAENNGMEHVEFFGLNREPRPQVPYVRIKRPFFKRFPLFFKLLKEAVEYLFTDFVER